MTKIQIALARKNGTLDMLYEQLVDRAIRERYTASREFSILRQRDEKPEAFAEYNAYAEECKARVKAELGIE